MGAVLVFILVAALAANAVYSLWEEHRQGILCACTGDCAKCAIQCRSNPKYYGTRQVGVPEPERRAAEEALRPENRPLLIRVIRKIRALFDLLCWWLFNLFGIVTAMGLIYGFGQKLLSLAAGG